MDIPEQIVSEKRDLMADYRTILANERTLLAYIRTSLTFFVVGITFVKFFGHFLIEIIGWILIPIGIIIQVKGIVSFRKTKRIIEEESAKF